MVRTIVRQGAFALLTSCATVMVSPFCYAQNDATQHTKEINEKYMKELQFSNKDDFELASKGLIEAVPNLVIKGPSAAMPAWDMTHYGFLKGDAPPTVNPSLWRNGMLNMYIGLFKVSERVYQVRGYDLSNISIIETDNGVIAIDPLLSAETAKAAMELYFKHRPRKPVVAVIHTHSHVDHYGGVKGVINEADVNAGKVKVIAPEGFLEHAISENVTAGTAMSRRAIYMYGAFAPPGPKGQVDAGLGKTTSNGTATLIPPTDTITKTGQEMTIDGVKIIFQLTPNTEAPSEMNFYFPQFKTICMAENSAATLHNVYTLRGAQVRDAQAWSKYLNEALQMWGNDAEAIFMQHMRPEWGKEKIKEYVQSQADMYKYIHDQTLRLANNGYTMTEIAEMIVLPKSLSNKFYNRGYYGTVNHDAKAVYQKYLGWYDGNPSHLHNLPPEDAAKRYVEYMGGADAVLARAKKSYDAGDYRWVAEVLNHVVFADPKNQAARNLEADALEQLAYQAESGPWRNVYLVGAAELRKGIPPGLPQSTTASADTVAAMSLDMMLDYLGVRLNGPKANDKNIVINMEVTGAKKHGMYLLELRNSVLNYTANAQSTKPDATVSISVKALATLAFGSGNSTMDGIKVTGDAKKFDELLSYFDNFNTWFNIVTP